MRFALIGAFGGFTAVSLGAFGAHALGDRLSEKLLDAFEVAVRYQMYHSLALFAVAWLVERGQGRLAIGSGAAFIAGMVLFSGSLYAYVLSGQRAFALITPGGGVCFLLGWGLLAAALWKSTNA